ncbi:hypothetical protein [Curtobacterium sp. SORGH_AS_0776]|uniref:hypothetical protein n=1 Tax=Curtobacterium sp. SORGH_AS_0776 TaxID=3041798 RepID=UPI0028591B4B|nr:hypothetical protein [Curtobacterium sp. SORGH_AS_0776]MDR6172287.1 hypothetical protein [Curtobacterium sp. SORGH_AS_0776]
MPASADVNARPFVSSVLVSGPTVSPDTGMPVTVNESTLNDPPPKPPPSPPLGGPCWVPVPLLSLELLLLSDCCCTWPENVLFSRVRTPVAAFTPLVLVTVCTSDALSVLDPRETASRDCDRSVEPLPLPELPWLPKSKLGRPVAEPVGVSVFVTVMSVPTP